VPAVPGKDQADTGSSSSAGDTWAELLARHRRGWLVEAIGSREMLDLDTERYPAASIARASADSAVVSIEDFSESADADLRRELQSAVGRGVPVVVGFRGGRQALQDAELLRDQLGDAVLVVQQLAAGSLIGAGGEPSNAAHLLVCANLGAFPGDGTAAELDARAVPLSSGYVAYLERSNRALRDANVRLARERLGLHDAAAATRWIALQEELAEYKRQAETNYERWIGAKNALEAPRYRAVDKVRDIAFSLPGVGFVLRWRKQRLQDRG
jgi:hypothetical protein